MSALFEILISASFWAAAVRIASPLIFATMGELICERAGVLNLGIEGIMVIGAFAGWMAVYLGAPLWWGVGVAMLAGMLFGLLHATLTVPFGLSQHVVGLGVTLLATSTSSFAYRLILPEVTSPPRMRCPRSRTIGSRPSNGELCWEIWSPTQCAGLAASYGFTGFPTICSTKDLQCICTFHRSARFLWTPIDDYRQ